MVPSYSIDALILAIHYNEILLVDPNGEETDRVTWGDGGGIEILHIETAFVSKESTPVSIYYRTCFRAGGRSADRDTCRAQMNLVSDLC